MSVVPFLLGFDTTRSEHLDSRHIMPLAHLTGSPYSASNGSHFGQLRVSACAGDTTMNDAVRIPIPMRRLISGLAFDRQRLRAWRSPTMRGDNRQQ